MSCVLPSAGLVRPKPTHRMEMEKWPGTTDGHVDPRHWCGDMQQAYKSHSVQCIRGVRSEQAARPSGVQGFVRTVYRRLEKGAMRTTIPIKARSECSLIGIFVHLSYVLGLQLLECAFKPPGRPKIRRVHAPLAGAVSPRGWDYPNPKTTGCESAKSLKQGSRKPDSLPTHCLAPGDTRKLSDYDAKHPFLGPKLS